MATPAAGRAAMFAALLVALLAAPRAAQVRRAAKALFGPCTARTPAALCRAMQAGSRPILPVSLPPCRQPQA